MSLDSSMFFRVSPFFLLLGFAEGMRGGGDQSAKRKNLDPSVCCAIDTICSDPLDTHPHSKLRMIG